MRSQEVEIQATATYRHLPVIRSTTPPDTRCGSGELDADETVAAMFERNIVTSAHGLVTNSFIVIARDIA